MNITSIKLLQFSHKQNCNQTARLNDLFGLTNDLCDLIVQSGIGFAKAMPKRKLTHTNYIVFNLFQCYE